MLIDNPPPFAGGGAGKHAYKLAKALGRMGHNVKIICPQCRAWKSCWEKFEGISTQRIGIPTSTFNFVFSLIYNIRLMGYLIARVHEYDILHIQGIRAVYSVLVVAKILRKKAFLTVLSADYWRSLTASQTAVRIPKWRLTILHNVNQFIVLNRFSEQLLLNDSISSSKISLIPNGTEIALHETDKCMMREKLKLAINKIIVLYAGRFHKQKNIPFLLKAWTILNNYTQNLRLILLGSGPEMSSIDTLINKFNLRQTVTPVGFVTNIADYMHAADIFVLPSKREGCSNALLEAMRHGMTCIVTNSSGNNEIIRHGVNGYLVDFNNERELAERIEQLSQNNELRHRIGREAVNTIMCNYSIEKIAQAHCHMYTET